MIRSGKLSDKFIGIGVALVPDSYETQLTWLHTLFHELINISPRSIHQLPCPRTMEQLQHPQPPIAHTPEPYHKMPPSSIEKMENAAMQLI